MSTHALDNQMNERLIKEMEDVKKQLRDVRTMQAQGTDAVNITITPYYELSYTLDHNGAYYAFFHLESPNGKPLFSTFEYDVCVGSWSADNLIFATTNNYADYWDVHHHTSYGYGDSDYVQERILIRNRSGSTQTFYIRGCWRYLVSNATGSAG